MTGILLRILLFAVIGGLIYFGVRRIWRDWKNQFRAEDKAIHQRDLRNAPAPTSSPSSATRTAPSVPRMATAGVDLTR